MEELEKAAKEVQAQLALLNELTKDMEGKGCIISYTCSEPYNKIDFLQISKLTKFGEK